MTQMTKLRLDYQKVEPFPWIGFCLGGVMLIVLVLIAIYFVKLRVQSDELSAKLEHTSSKKTEHAFAEPTTEKARAEQSLEVKNANEVIHHLSVPWDVLFKAVEVSTGSKITLLSLEPDFDKKQVKISGEASNYQALMMYVTHLGAQTVFNTVYLQNHDVRQEDPDKPVRFTLLANWRDIL